MIMQTCRSYPGQEVAGRRRLEGGRQVEGDPGEGACDEVDDEIDDEVDGEVDVDDGMNILIRCDYETSSGGSGGWPDGGEGGQCSPPRGLYSGRGETYLTDLNMESI